MTVQPFIARPPTLQRDVERLWMLRRLLRERALDPLAADQALRDLRDHGHPRVAALALATSSDAADLFYAAPGVLTR